ncbi:transcriptional regulator [Dyadobacter luteus]|uniref:Transcriptional regulator n=1 Tax=Dyadobacter luteus TaxID=2259619 RepID=A0A3D8YH50_9BACT|nr:helix-turn-helix transcriptional regulator [Dyadobacter luteus]REA64169.1 transcriptional regulator [Dyadobacter luteus]
MSIVSNNIKYLRKLSGLTQEQFANKIDIKRSLLGAYEEARANPNLTNLENMASAFGISVDNLIKSDLRQSAEKSELSLPFTRSTQMTVSHSGMVSAPRKPVVTEFRQQEKPEAILKNESTVEVAKQLSQPLPDPVHRQETKIPDAARDGGQASYKANNEGQVPVFNNSYSADQSALPVAKTFPIIQLVSVQQQQEYIRHHQNPSFVASLPPFQLPNLPWDYYRAFEIGNDFTYPGALLVGSFIRNWYDIRPDVNYIFLLKNEGIVYRKAINEVQANGSFRLISDLNTIPAIHARLSDILEVWEVKAFVSIQMPAVIPSMEKIGQLVDELTKELQRK